MNPNASLTHFFTSCKSKHNLKSKYEHLALVLNSEEGRNNCVNCSCSQLRLLKCITLDLHRQSDKLLLPNERVTHLITHDYEKNNCSSISPLIGFKTGNSLFLNIFKFCNVYK